MFDNKPNDYETDVRHIALFKSTFSPLAGMLCCGYYLHTIALPILKNNAKQEKNTRDLFLGYFLVYICYILCGSLGYFGFSASTFKTIHLVDTQNALNMFGSLEIIPMLIRLSTFF